MTDRVKVRVSAEDEGVSTLLRTLSKQLGDVQRGQAKANAEANAGARAQGALAKAVRTTVADLRRLALGYAAIRAVRFVGDQLQAADALGKLAEKTGASTEALSILAFAGETADASIDDLAAGLRGLSSSTADLQKGGKSAVETFKAIGLTVDDLKGLSVDETFKRVATAVGGYEDSLEKAKVARDIFGKSGESLIPLLNQIADEGFDTLAASATNAGRVISKEAAQAAADFNDQLSVMKGQAGAAALAFGQGVVPALSDVFTVLTDLKGVGEQTFAETLGAGAAKIVRATALIAVTAFKSIGEELGLLARVGVETWRAIKAAAKFDFDAAGTHIDAANDAFEEMRTTAERVFHETKDALDKAEKDRDAKSVAARKAREAQEKKRLVLAAEKDADDLAKARREAEENAREGEGKLLAASLALRDQAVEQAFAKGLSSLEAYFAARQRTITEAGAQELAALKASRDAIAKQPAATPVERVQRDDQLAQKDVQIKVATAKLSERLVALDIERGAVAASLAETVADAELAIRTARGDTAAEDRKAIDERVENYRVALAKLGTLTAAEQARLTSDFRITLTLDVDARENQAKIASLFSDIDRERTRLEQEVNLGLRSQASAQAELAQFEADRLPTLKALADEMQRFAAALGNPELKAAAEDLQVRLEGLGRATSESARLSASFATDVAEAAKDSLSDFLGTTITQVNTLGDAFKSLASSIIASIQRIVANLIATKIIEQITKIFRLGTGPATPDINFAGIDSTLRGAGYARGGYTGAGGKYQPAGIVHRGEYVFPQEAVRRLGISRLDALAGLKTPSIATPRRGYAEGGLVTVAGGGQITGTLTLEVDEGVIARGAKVWFQSPDGQRSAVQVAQKQRGRYRTVLGGG